jgi:hypothetical protein
MFYILRKRPRRPKQWGLSPGWKLTRYYSYLSKIKVHKMAFKGFGKQECSFLGNNHVSHLEEEPGL